MAQCCFQAWSAWLSLTPITCKSDYNSNSADAETSDSSAGVRQACSTDQHTFDGLLEVGRLLLCGLPLQQSSLPFRLHLQHNAAATCHKAFIPVLPDIHILYEGMREKSTLRCWPARRISPRNWSHCRASGSSDCLV